MTEQEMIRHLHSAIEHAAPDAVGDVLSRCGAQKGTEDMTQQERPVKNRRTRPHGAVAGCRVPCADNRRGRHAVYAVPSGAEHYFRGCKPQCGIELNAKSRVISAVAPQP